MESPCLFKIIKFVKNCPICQKNISTKDSDEAFQLKVFNLKESSAHVPQANPSIQSSVPTAVKKPSAEKKKMFFLPNDQLWPPNGILLFPNGPLWFAT